MQRTKRSGTRPELALRSVLHRRGLRFVVDGPVPGGNRRRRVDILLGGARIAVFVDGCFWHACPEHCHLPKTNTSWWRLKFRGIVRRREQGRYLGGRPPYGYQFVDAGPHPNRAKPVGNGGC